MRNIYTFFINVYSLIIGIVSLFIPKAKKWILGRKNLLNNIKSEVKTGSIIWFHAASVGEFEQARPVIEAIKNQTPQKQILLTFFSPSGYELRKNYKYADYVFYLPIDTPKSARRFIELIKPEKVYFVKYEFWFNLINELHKKEIPLFLISGIFRKNQHFFKWYGAWFRKHLLMFNIIFVQDKNSADLLKSIGIKNNKIAGDTRFDRVYQNTKAPLQFRSVAYFTKASQTIICGSTWPKDEALLLDYLQTNNSIKLIIAPHEVHKSHINDIESKFKQYKPLLWSQHQEESEVLDNSRILIIDSVGKLMHLYQYADIAYIGGGFGVGIHNILEAACFGKPIFFGPNYQKFNEARDLIKLKGAYSVDNSSEFASMIDKLLKNKELLQQKQNVCLRYIEENIGATEIIIEN